MKTTLGALAFGSILSVLALQSGGETVPSAAPDKEQASMKAGGTFEVKLTPQPIAEGLGRMTIDKTFKGDLEGSSVGEMLSAMGGVKGSAGYVAIEKVTGKLGGKSGTFVLQHSGTMDRGAPSLVVTVVPDSGTCELEGLEGRLDIRIEGGQHFYDFEYSLGRPAPPEKP